MDLTKFQQELLITPDLRHQCDYWFRSRKDPEMRDWTKNFKHEVLLSITPNQILTVIQNSSHALAGITYQDNHIATRDASPNWPLQFLFHGYLEREEMVPTWSQFFQQMMTIYRPYWYDIVLSYALGKGLSLKQAERGIQWRLGNHYYSAIREVHLFSVLRYQYDIPVNYHILADVEFKVDSWYKKRIICLRLPNALEKRKRKPGPLLIQAGYIIHEQTVQRQKINNVWLVDKPSIQQLAEALTD